MIHRQPHRAAFEFGNADCHGLLRDKGHFRHNSSVTAHRSAAVLLVIIFI